MNASLLLLPWLLPLLAAPLALGSRGRWLPALASLPALAAVALVPLGAELRLPWLMLGTHLGLDATARLFLGFSAALWLAAALHLQGGLDSRRETPAGPFRLFFLLSMAGNFLLILAQDALTFYLGFALMGLAAYGLVAQRPTAGARRAARVYLAWTLVGELALFAALVPLAAGQGGTDLAALAGTAPPAVLVALLIMGFGIKLALPGLHFWLPLAYPAAPAAGAAVLSGPLISAGLLGWMRFLPPGDASLAPWGAFLVLVGSLAVPFALLRGLTQRDPKAVLGYSSIGQMGVLSAGFGIALAAPEAAPALLAALSLYTVHHLLVKGGLFLGHDLLTHAPGRPWVLAGLVLLALALAGAPLTSGALAKGGLEAALPVAWGWLAWPFALGALASTLLMARFLYLAWERRPKPQPQPRPADPVARLGWGALLAGILTWPLALGAPGSLLGGGGLLLIGLGIAALGWWTQPPFLTRWVGILPPGSLARLGRGGRWRHVHLMPPDFPNRIGHLQARLRQRLVVLLQPAPGPELPWPVAGALWLGIGGLLYLGLALAGA